MRIAIISPSRFLDQFSAGTGYHLALCHLVLEDPAYREFYARVSSSEYVILDNSAHERGVGETARTLLRAADMINPQEIVLPDVLFDGQETLARSRAAVNAFRQYRSRFKLVGVPQGQSLQEVLECLRGLLDLGVDVIGISKDFERIEPGYLTFVEKILRVAGSTETHLLGWPRQISFLYHAAQEFGERLRGIDSAKPLVYAWAKIRLPTDPRRSVPPYPRRPSNYFSLSPTSRQDSIPRSLARHNIRVFAAWAKGEIPRSEVHPD